MGQMVEEHPIQPEHSPDAISAGGLSLLWLPVRRSISVLPHWVLALVLLCPSFAMICYSHPVWQLTQYLDTPWGMSTFDLRHLLLGLAYFLPGAIKRLSRRDVLIMAALAVLWFILNAAVVGLMPRVGWAIGWMSGPARTVFLVGLGEWCLVRPRTRKTLVWLLLAGVAIACAAALATVLLAILKNSLLIQAGGGVRSYIPWSALGGPCALAFLTWFILPAAFRLARATGSRLRYLALAVPVGAVAAQLMFWNVWLYSLAHMTMRGVGPFSSVEAAYILADRGRPEDLEAIWQAVEKTDWDVPVLDEVSLNDIRSAWIRALVEHHHSQTAERLAKLIRHKHSKVLVDGSAKLLGEHRQYQAAPMLTWHAFDRYFSSNSKCGKALTAMGVPRAACVILMDPYAPNSVGGQVMKQDARETLARLLGHDAGPLLADWADYYDRMIAELPNQLPLPYDAETDIVFKCGVRIMELECALRDYRYALRRRRLVEAGRDALLQDVFEKADSDMIVFGPTWNEGPVAELQEELRQYEQRVRERILKYFPKEATSATAPATGPATAPTGAIQPHPQR